MMRRFAHIVAVLAVSFAITMAGALAGNVLCMGDDGHLAIEPPHAGPAAAQTTGRTLPGEDHGPCSDITANVAVAVRQNAAGVAAPASVMVPPILGLALPAELAFVAAPPRPTVSIDAAQPAAALGCLRCVVLLI